MSNELNNLREWFVTRSSRRIGAEFKDLSMALKGMEYILAKIEEKRAWHIMDLGMGFSTLALRRFVKTCRATGVPDTEGENHVTQFCSADHDRSWVEFVKQLLVQKKLRNDHCYSLDEIRGKKAHCGYSKLMDVIIVDHGPTMGTRVEDLPWVVSCLEPDGIILLDDFRRTNNFQKVCTAELKKLGFSCIVEDAGRSSENRAVGIARRA
jgi:predicted O-methyltransferase YrrM